MNKNTEAIREEWEAELVRTQGAAAPKVTVDSTGKLLVCLDHWYTTERVVEMIARLKTKPSLA